MYFKRSVFIFLVFFLHFSISKSQSVEYSLKASFIEKFARFTEWETNVTGENFVIAVLGRSPFYNELGDMAKKTKINGLPVKVIYLKNIEEANACQLIFICSSERKNIPDIIKFIENKNILLIGDTPGYCEQGVHFNFYLESNNTVHFEINVKALEKSKLKPDMHLLSIGKIIN